MGSSLFSNVKWFAFLDKNKHIPLKKLYGKYILRLSVAYVFWSCIYAIYNSIYDSGNMIIEKIKYFLSYCISGEIHTWYILVTIGLYIALPLLKCIVDKGSDSLIKYWLFVMFIFVSIIPSFIKLGLPYLSGYVAYINKYMDLDFFLGYTFLFVLGYYIYNKDFTKKVKTIIYVLAFIGALYSLFVLIVLRNLLGIQIGALDYLSPNIVFMSMGVFLFFKDFVSKCNFSEKSAKIISSISKLTFGIYLIHVLVLKVLSRIGLGVTIAPFSISYIVISIIVFLVSLAVIFVVSKIPIIN